MQNKYVYTAFGEPYTPGTTVATGLAQRHTFTGREASAVGAPMYYRNRMYTPGLGRFGRRDPVLGGDPLYNAYGFPHSNAVMYADASGNDCCECAIGGFRRPFQPCDADSDGDLVVENQPGLCIPIDLDSRWCGFWCKFKSCTFRVVYRCVGAMGLWTPTGWFILEDCHTW
jgi:RHS repeat-associated protein